MPSFNVKVADVVEPSSFLAVKVVPDILNSLNTDTSKNSACAGVGAVPSAA